MDTDVSHETEKRFEELESRVAALEGTDTETEAAEEEEDG